MTEDTMAILLSIINEIDDEISSTLRLRRYHIRPVKQGWKYTGLLIARRIVEHKIDKLNESYKNQTL